MNPSELQATIQRMHQQAMRSIWTGTEWLDASTLASEAGLPPRLLLIWEQERKLFSLNRSGARVYPAYAFADDFAPLPVIAAVWSILPHYTPLALAFFFESTSSFLGGGRARELVRTQPDRVLALAQDRFDAEMYAG